MGAAVVHFDRTVDRASVRTQDDNDGARRLYRSIGFDEERVLLPLRIGFTAAG